MAATTTKKMPMKIELNAGWIVWRAKARLRYESKYAQ